MRGETYLIPCTIEKGGFTSERTFEIEVGDGGRLVGTAYVEHLLDSNKQPLDEDAPAYGQAMPGFVKCRVIRAENGRALVEVPSADIVRVPADALIEAD